jgi:hypothetical protein
VTAKRCPPLTCDFFPKGDYKQLQVLLVDGETGNTEVIDRPWK